MEATESEGVMVAPGVRLSLGVVGGTGGLLEGKGLVWEFGSAGTLLFGSIGSTVT